jgi:hypothetical protein
VQALDRVDPDVDPEGRERRAVDEADPDDRRHASIEISSEEAAPDSCHGNGHPYTAPSLGAMELALGALARYGVEGAVARRATAFPWGIVNVSGSFLLGVVFTLLGERLVFVGESDRWHGKPRDRLPRLPHAQLGSRPWGPGAGS